MDTNQTIDTSKIRFRYFRVVDKVKQQLNTSEKDIQAEHVLTVATYLEDNKIHIGYSLNRTPKEDLSKVFRNEKIRAHDRFSAETGRKIAEERLIFGERKVPNGPREKLVLEMNPNEPKVVLNIVHGLLKAPVPSAVKRVLRKHLKEFIANQAANSFSSQE